MRGIDFGLLDEGQSIWKTDDPQLTSRLRKTFTGPDPVRKRPLDLRVRCVAGEPLEIVATLAPLAPALRGEGLGVRGFDEVKASDMHVVSHAVQRLSSEEPLTLTLSPQSRGEGTRQRQARPQNACDPAAI